MAEKVLLIDDETEHNELMKSVLGERYAVTTAEDVHDGLRIARQILPDIILLDINMPKLDGISACNFLRSHEATKHIPVIMLTGADDSEHRTEAFANGADDFISKPFRVRELKARIESKLRRMQELKGETTVLTCGNLQMNVDKFEVLLDGKQVPMSVLEFNILKFFVENKDKVIPRKKVLEAIWRDSVVAQRTVDAHMVSLRKKLAGFTHKLKTVYGAGYTLTERRAPTK